MRESTGDIYEGTAQELKSMEEALGEKLVRIPKRDLPKVKAMSTEQRKSYAKQLRKRRKRAAEARKVRRQQRKAK